jgi:hypothetical protein
MKRYFADLDAKGETIAEWAVGRRKRTLDPCSVTPRNRATAALYTYTPWVGSMGKGCGASKYLGSSGVAAFTHKYLAALGSTVSSRVGEREPVAALEEEQEGD